MNYYIVVKDFIQEGCLAVNVDNGLFIDSIDNFIAEKNKKLEVVLLSKPSAFMEYAPYEFVDSIDELKERILQRF